MSLVFAWSCLSTFGGVTSSGDWVHPVAPVYEGPSGDVPVNAPLHWLQSGQLDNISVAFDVSDAFMLQWLEQTVPRVWERFESGSSRKFAVIGCSNGGVLFSIPCVTECVTPVYV